MVLIFSHHIMAVPSFGAGSEAPGDACAQDV
jgi:hypothetical protein